MVRFFIESGIKNLFLRTTFNSFLRPLSKKKANFGIKKTLSHITSCMTNLNLIKKKIAKKEYKISVIDPSELLAEFFNGVVIKIDEECNNES